MSNDARSVDVTMASSSLVADRIRSFPASGGWSAATSLRAFSIEPAISSSSRRNTSICDELPLT